MRFELEPTNTLSDGRKREGSWTLEPPKEEG